MADEADIQELHKALLNQYLSLRVLKAKPDLAIGKVISKLARINLDDIIKTYASDILKLCPVIVTNPITALTHLNALNEYDVILIDEASQLPIANALSFFLNKRQLVVFGDTKQLPITAAFKSNLASSDEEEDYFNVSNHDQSILDLAAFLHSKDLMYHYRSKYQDLFKISNAKFYSNALSVVPSIYLDPKNLPENLGYEVNSYQVDAKDVNIIDNTNILEAQMIAQRVKQLQANPMYKNLSIGILTLNEKQQIVITKELLKLDVSMDEDELQLWVRNLERCQGREADIIIISFGPPPNLTKKGEIVKALSNINRQDGDKRLNVLFTRARNKIIIYVCFDYNQYKSLNADNNLYLLYEYINFAKNGDYQIEDDKQSTRSIFARFLNSFNYGQEFVDTCIGSNDFSIDLGVKAPNSNHYHLGWLLLQQPCSINTLLTKIKVLERAGWKLAVLSPIKLITDSDYINKIASIHNSASSNTFESFTMNKQPAEFSLTNLKAIPTKLFTKESLSLNTPSGVNKDFNDNENNVVSQLPIIKPINQNAKEEKIDLLCAKLEMLTIKEFSKIDYISKYEHLLDPVLLTYDHAKIKIIALNSTDKNQWQALLIYYAHKIAKGEIKRIDSSIVDSMFRNIKILYKKGSYQLGYFLAQISRMFPSYEATKYDVCSYLVDAYYEYNIKVEEVES
jgi:hypothetical protein